MTDSVHTFNKHWSKRVKTFMKKQVKHWACSSKNLDKKLPPAGGSLVVSAGTDNHDRASSAAMNSIFTFFESVASL